MTIDGNIRDKSLQFDINRETAKISALSSGKVDKYGYLIGEELLPSVQSRTIKQATFSYQSLEKAQEKQTKPIEIKEKKQAEALKVLKPDV